MEQWEKVENIIHMLGSITYPVEQHKEMKVVFLALRKLKENLALRRLKMEEVCTCKESGNQENWLIYRDRLQCGNCRQEVKFTEDVFAKDLLRLTNKF